MENPGSFAGAVQGAEIVATVTGVSALARGVAALGRSLFVRTPFGTAVQEFTPSALALRSEVAAGRQVFRGGMLGRSTAAEGQFFAAESPLNPGFASRLGAGSFSGMPQFVLGGTLRPGTRFITRTAPGFGKNTGGALEIVTESGAFRPGFFVMP